MITEQDFKTAQEKLIEAIYNKGKYLSGIDGYSYHIAVEDATGEIVCGDLCGENWWSVWHDGYTEIGRVTGMGCGQEEDDKDAYYSQLILYPYKKDLDEGEYYQIISFEGKHFSEW